MHIPIARVRRLMRLLGEAFELCGDRDKLHAHLLRGLGEIIGAAAVMRVQVFDYGVGGGHDIRDGLDAGFDDDYRRRVAEFYYTRSGTEPTLTRMQATHDELERDGVVSVRRSDLVGDSEWYASALVGELRRPARLDDSIYTARRIGARRADGVGAFRAWGDSPFTEEDREIVRLFDIEVLQRFPLPGSSPAVALPRSVETALTPRERATYAWLLTAASEKEIATKLGVSPHTVHEYVKGIYRKLGVRSRAEAMAAGLGNGRARA